MQIDRGHSAAPIIIRNKVTYSGTSDLFVRQLYASALPNKLIIYSMISEREWWFFSLRKKTRNLPWTATFHYILYEAARLFITRDSHVYICDLRSFLNYVSYWLTVKCVFCWAASDNLYSPVTNTSLWTSSRRHFSCPGGNVNDKGVTKAK